VKQSIFIFFLTGLGVLASVVPASALELEGLSGETVNLDSLLARGPVVLNFWATWCKPCRLEMPHLESIYKELKTRGVQFAAVSLDNPRWKDRVKAYIRKNGFTLPVYIDTKGKLARHFRVIAVPTTVVLGEDGNVVYQTRGYRPGAEIILKKKIDSYLKHVEGKTGTP